MGSSSFAILEPHRSTGRTSHCVTFGNLRNHLYCTSSELLNGIQLFAVKLATHGNLSSPRVQDERVQPLIYTVKNQLCMYHRIDRLNGRLSKQIIGGSALQR